MEICGVWVQAEGGVKVIQIGMEPCMAASKGVGERLVPGPSKAQPAER